MKKLLTILAASAMFFAFGEGINNGADFEAYTSTGENSFKPSDYEPGTNVYFWCSSSSVGNVISNHVAGALEGVTVPDMYDGHSNTNFLYLETEAPLFRTVVPNDQSSFTGVSILENPIYLDTLVKFTAADSAFTQLEDDADKIAIEYVEHEEESHEDQTTGQTVIDSAGFTNFVVRAGYLENGTIVQTNYYAAVPEGFDKDAWHRLTVRSIANIDGTGEGKGHVGFVVYLDQVPLKYATSVAVGDATFEGSLNADVKKNFYNGDIHALYPSAVDPIETTGQTISAVAFSGNGSVDDVVFTTTKPGFINESSIVTVTWDEHVATLTLNNESVEGFVAGVAGSTTIEPDNGAVLVDVTFASGWEAGTYTIDGDGSWDSTTSSFIDLSSGDTCNIVSMFPLYEVNGVSFDDLDAALTASAKGTAQAPATLKLLADCNQVLNFTEGYIVLDLVGCDIQGNGSDFSIVNAGANLTITNSGTEASILIPADNGAGGPGTSPLYAAAGFTTIQAGTFEGIIYSPALLDQEDSWANYMLITGGKFMPMSAYDPTDPTSFYLYACVAQGLDLTQNGDYVQVGGGGGGDTPTEIDVPTAASNLVYDGTEQTGVAAGTGYTLTGVTAATNAGEYTATATPGSGYAWVGGSTDATNITWSIAKASVTATVSLTVTEATYDSTKTTVTDYTTPSVNFGLDAPELVENTDYTVAWSATEVTGAGTFTYTVSPVASSNYTFTEASVTLTITAGGSYPHYIPDDAGMKSKYDGWKSYYSVADGDNDYDAAFLLNIAPDAEDQTLKPTAITMEGGKVVITANQTLTSVNGKVYVKVATTLAGLSTAEWAEATLSEGKVQVTPGSSDTAGFYKIKVDF